MPLITQNVKPRYNPLIFSERNAKKIHSCRSRNGYVIVNRPISNYKPQLTTHNQLATSHTVSAVQAFITSAAAYSDVTTGVA
jgi:hypothetical protein